MSKHFYVRQEKFEGPLDLLLDLISKEKLPVSEISLAKVTEEYLAAVKKMEAVNQEELAEFLVIAAQLMLIKSKALLPSLELSEEEEESIGDLERRLKEYAAIKEFSKAIMELEKKEMAIYTRDAYLGIPAIFYPPKKLGESELSKLFSGILAALPTAERLDEERIKRVISLEETIRSIQDKLQAKIEKAFSELIKGSIGKVEVIIAFLAILELSKQKLVSLRQDDTFGDIMIKREISS